MHSEKRPNPDRSLESLEARLRSLPPLPVPVDLEARLLGTIPADSPIPQLPLLTLSPDAGGEGKKRRRWVLWGSVVGVLAAACLLVVLIWLGREQKNPVPNPPAPDTVQRGTPESPDAARMAPWVKARRNLDEAEMPTFTWPLEETSPVPVSTAIPPDLLD